MNVSVSTLSKLIAGEETCLYMFWYGMRHKEEVEEISKRLVEWKINHTDMVLDLSLKLKGGEIKKEEYVRLDVLTGTLVGKTDLVHITDDEVVIYDCKSGRPNSAHHVQMMAYLYMINKLGVYKDKQLKGIIHYENDDVQYTLDNIPSDLPSQIERYTTILLDDSPAPKFSGESCKWCRVECEKRKTVDEG